MYILEKMTEKEDAFRQEKEELRQDYEAKLQTEQHEKQQQRV